MAFGSALEKLVFSNIWIETGRAFPRGGFIVSVFSVSVNPLFLPADRAPRGFGPFSASLARI